MLQASWSKLSEKLTNDIKISVGQAVLELLWSERAGVAHNFGSQSCEPFLVKIYIMEFFHRGSNAGGGYSAHVKAFGDVPPKMGYFFTKIRHGSHLGQKNP